jgi:hypothetical protein
MFKILEIYNSNIIFLTPKMIQPVVCGLSPGHRNTNTVEGAFMYVWLKDVWLCCLRPHPAMTDVSVYVVESHCMLKIQHVGFRIRLYYPPALC